MRRLAVLLCVIPLAAPAQPAEQALLAGDSAPRVRLATAAEDLRRGFESALARYDAEIAAEPFRVVTRIARCRFIDAFQFDFEYVEWIEDVYARVEECEAALDPFAEHPEVRLWRLESVYDDAERLAAAQRAATELDRYGWTSGQRARLYTVLADVSDRLDEERRFRERTAEYARLALQHDLRADVRLILAAYFLETDDRAAALEALTSPFDGHDPEDNWYLVRKMSYFAELGERDHVLAAYSRLASSSSYYDRSEAAAALRGVGELALAEEALDSPAAASFGTEDDWQLFLSALSSGDAEKAQTAYEALRDGGWLEDPVGANRIALLVEHPGLPWRLRDLAGGVGALLFLAIMLALWSIPLCLVHYRGLANRLRSALSPPSDGLGLRQAFLGVAAFSLASLASLYTAGPVRFFGDPYRPWLVIAEQRQLATMWVAESVLAIVLLGATAVALRRHFRRWWGTDWSAATAVLVGVGVAVVFRVPLLLMVLSGFDASAILRFDDGTWQTLGEIHALYGATVMLAVVSLAAPLVEEFLFRGLLLRAFLRHVSFTTANVIQAALFALLHLNLAGAPFLFALGLAAGWLARRSGGLLAPIVMHGVFNLIAGALITF